MASNSNSASGICLVVILVLLPQYFKSLTKNKQCRTRSSDTTIIPPFPIIWGDFPILYVLKTKQEVAGNVSNITGIELLLKQLSH